MPSWVENLIFLVLGGLGSAFFVYARRRVRVLSWTVAHVQIGAQTPTAVANEVQFLFRGEPVANLYVSTVRLTNTSQKDFENLPVTIYGGPNTKLLTEQAEVEGVVGLLKWTADYSDFLGGIDDPSGKWQMVSGQREYAVPVLNRGQTAMFSYLVTTVVSPGQPSVPPSVFVSVRHPGIQVKWRAVGAVVLGVPYASAIWVGLVAILVFYAALAFYMALPQWAECLILVLAALFVRVVGACLVRVGKALWDMLIQ